MYVDKAHVHVEDSALRIQTEEEIFILPAAQFLTLQLGPGVTITSAAMDLLSRFAITVCWVGEGMVRFYSSATPHTKSARFLMRQAELSSNLNARVKVAKAMYQLRFPDERVDGLSIAQLRGREGTRMKRAYAELAKQHGFEWKKRAAQMGQIEEEDYLNKSITMGTASLYGIAHAVIVSLGASPGLGFVHNGHRLAFVFDIADLYKTEVLLPIVFEVAADLDLRAVMDSAIRARMRAVVFDGALISRMVEDIKRLFELEEDPLDDELYLLNDQGEFLNAQANRNWADK